MKRQEITTSLLPSGYRQLEYLETTGQQWIESGIPIKLDSKPGLYDLVNNQFYTNAGTGEFLYN